MLGRIFTVGGYTLLSRLTGFARDIMLAAILGAGPVADAFFVAQRLPNLFRRLLAEGLAVWVVGGPDEKALANEIVGDTDARHVDRCSAALARH